MSTIYKPIITRIDTTANWKTFNPTPANGEQCVEVLGGGLFKLKVGDGVTPWIALKYFVDSQTSAIIGDLNKLTTPDKSSVVNAINSVQAEVKDLKDSLGGSEGLTVEEFINKLIVEELTYGIESIDGHGSVPPNKTQDEEEEEEEPQEESVLDGDSDEVEEYVKSPLEDHIGWAVGDTVIEQGMITGALKKKLELSSFNVVKVNGDKTYADSNITNTIKEIPLDEFNFLLLGGIIDDFRKNKPLGTINDFKRGIASTFCGGLTEAIKTGLEQMNNSGEIILVLPHNNVEPAYSTYPNYYEINSDGHSLRDYIEKAKEIADSCNIPCADVNGKSGINETTSSKYLRDGYNVTTEGAKVIVDIIYETIINSPYFVED